MDLPDRLPCARNFMTACVRTVTPDTNIREVIRILLEHNLSNAPVVVDAHGENHLVGFISERDCLAVQLDELCLGSPSPTQTARTVMRRHPICVPPDTDVLTLASMFASHGFRHLPVTEGNRLVGIVSRRDVLTALADCHKRARAEKKCPFIPDLRQLIHHRLLITD